MAAPAQKAPGDTFSIMKKIKSSFKGLVKSLTGIKGVLDIISTKKHLRTMSAYLEDKGGPIPSKELPHHSFQGVLSYGVAAAYASMTKAAATKGTLGVISTVNNNLGLMVFTAMTVSGASYMTYSGLKEITEGLEKVNGRLMQGIDRMDITKLHQVTAGGTVGGIGVADDVKFLGENGDDRMRAIAALLMDNIPMNLCVKTEDGHFKKVDADFNDVYSATGINYDDLAKYFAYYTTETDLAGDILKKLEAQGILLQKDAFRPRRVTEEQNELPEYAMLMIDAFLSPAYARNQYAVARHMIQNKKQPIAIVSDDAKNLIDAGALEAGSPLEGRVYSLELEHGVHMLVTKEEIIAVNAYIDNHPEVNALIKKKESFNSRSWMETRAGVDKGEILETAREFANTRDSYLLGEVSHDHGTHDASAHAPSSLSM